MVSGFGLSRLIRGNEELSGLIHNQGQSSESGPATIRGAISGLQPSKEKFAGLRDRHIADANSTKAEEGRFRNGLSSAIQQKFAGNGTGFASSLDLALKKGKARQGIEQRGENAIQNQSLRDRIEIVRSGIQKRGKAVEGLGRAANIRQGVDVSAQAASDFTQASRANAFGTAAGAGAASLKDFFKNRNRIEEIDPSTIPKRRPVPGGG